MWNNPYYSPRFPPLDDDYLEYEAQHRKPSEIYRDNDDSFPVEDADPLRLMYKNSPRADAGARELG